MQRRARAATRGRSAAVDVEVYLSGGVSQGYTHLSGVGHGSGRVDDDATGDDQGYAELEEADFLGADAGFESESIELVVEQLRQLGEKEARRRAAERLERAVRAVCGVTSVSASEATGSVLIEASALLWLRAGQSNRLDDWPWKLESEIIGVIRSLGMAARSAAFANLEVCATLMVEPAH